jgi:hypothetical protein
MGNIRFTNNASATLAAGILSGDTSLTLGAGQGSRFPSPAIGQYAKCTLEDIAGNLEIVHMTARGGDVVTVTRAQEGTLALAFASGSRFELRITAGVAQEFLQRTADTMSGAYNCADGVFTGGSFRDAETVNTPMRGDTGVATNQILVPPGGGPPTIGGSVIFHAGNLTQATVNALAFPVGVVLMFNGLIGNIPAGFQLCDGTNGTQDLRGKFVIGAGGAYSVGVGGGSASTTTAAGGSHTHVIQGTALTIAQLPSHTHLVGARGSNASSNSEPKDFIDDYPGSGSNVESGPTGSGATHTHVADASVDHTHTVATLPPYVGLFFIQKV